MVEEDSGAVDVAVLRTVQTNLEGTSLVETARFQPTAADPRQVSAVLDSAQYPDSVTAARLDIRWFRNGDFSVHYVEAHRDDSRWQCRWDRHPNEHNARRHFHPPPDASDAIDVDVSPYARELLPTVLQWIEERIADLW